MRKIKFLVASLLFCAISYVGYMGYESVTMSDVGEVGEIIVYDSQKAYSFKDIMDVVDFVPLKLNGLMLDDFSEVVVKDSSIFVVDKTLKKTIYHFNKTGKYINTIGTVGRAYNEYLELSDFTVSDNSVLVFDSQNRQALHYALDGTLQKKDMLQKEFEKAYLLDDDYILYLGDCNGNRKWKLFMEKSDNEYLKSNDDVIHFSELFSVFCNCNDSIYVRETLSNSIYLLYNERLVKLYTFDFGFNNIPEEFCKQSSVDNSMEILSKSEYTYQRQFCFSEDYCLVENVINKWNGALSVYAILDKSNHDWVWVKELDRESSFYQTFKFIDDEGFFYFLLDDVKLEKSNVTDFMNFGYGLLKCRLKVKV